MAGTIFTVITVIATVIATVASIKTLLRPKAKPSIEECRVTLPIKSARKRYPHGNIVLTNSGKKICYITDLKMLWENGIDFEIFIVSFEEERIKDKNPKGIELPLPIQPYQKNCKVYFKAKEVGQYQGELPEELILEVRFDCSKKTFSKTLKKEKDRAVYT